MSAIQSAAIRSARLADSRDLLLMMALFYRAEGLPFRRARVAKGLRRLLRDERVGVVLVADRDDGRGIVGYAVGTYGFDLEFAGPDAYVTDLFVRPRHRRSGLGGRLLEATIGALGRGGAHAAHLLVWPENTAARALYAKAGFAEIPRVVMTRLLPGM